jgi:hypothetical protein
MEPRLRCIPQERGDSDPLDAKSNGQIPGPGIIPSISSFLTLTILIFKWKP